MNRRVLLVDDDQNLLRACERGLRSKFSVTTAIGGPEGLELLRSEEPFATIVSDMRMPGMDGIQFLERARELSPESVRMMLTGNADLETAISAVNNGEVFRFITKPCASDALGKFIQAGTRQYELIRAEKELLEGTLQGAIGVCTQILAGVDPRGHGLAVEIRDVARPMAELVGVEAAWELELACMLARIGRATIPPIVVHRERKGSQLTPAEISMFRNVPKIGHDLLVGVPRLEGVAKIVLHSEDHFDGQGDVGTGAAREDIPIASRLLKVVSDFVHLKSLGEATSATIEAMVRRVGWYDKTILEKLGEYLCSTEQHDALVGEKSMDVGLEELEIGDVIKAPVETEDSLLLILSGTTLTATMLDRLRNFNEVSAVRVPIRIDRLTSDVPCVDAVGPGA